MSAKVTLRHMRDARAVLEERLNGKCPIEVTTWFFAQCGMAYWACPAPECGKLYTCKAHCKRHHSKKHEGQKFPDKDEVGNLHNLLAAGQRAGVTGNASRIVQQPQPAGDIPGGQPQAMSANVTGAAVPTTHRVTRAVRPEQSPFPPPTNYNSFQSSHTNSLSYGNYLPEDPAILSYRVSTALPAPSSSVQAPWGLGGLAPPADFANVQSYGAIQARRPPPTQTQTHRCVPGIDGHTHARYSAHHVDNAYSGMASSVSNYGSYTEQGTPVARQEDPTNFVDVFAQSSAGPDEPFSSYHPAGSQSQY